MRSKLENMGKYNKNCRILRLKNEQRFIISSMNNMNLLR